MIYSFDHLKSIVYLKDCHFLEMIESFENSEIELDFDIIDLQNLNLSNFETFLEILNFFMVDSKNLPIELFTFIISNCDECISIIKNSKNNYLHSKICLEFCEKCMSFNQSKLYYFVKIGNLECFKYFVGSDDYDYLFYQTVIREAIVHKQIDCLKYFHNMGHNIQRYCPTAAYHGSLECLIYLHKNGCDLYNSCDEAIYRGNLDCLKYAHENGGKLKEDSFKAAVEKGHLNCVIYLHKNKCQIPENICLDAAKSSIDCLKYLHSNGFWNDEICITAAEYGNLECLKYGYLHTPKDKIIYHELYFAAIKYDNSDCLKFLHESNVLKKEHEYYSIIQSSVENGSLKCLMYICQNMNHKFHREIFWKVDMVKIAVERRHLDCLKYLYAPDGNPKNGFLDGIFPPLLNDIFEIGKNTYSYECLYYLSDQGLFPDFVKLHFWT